MRQSHVSIPRYRPRMQTAVARALFVALCAALFVPTSALLSQRGGTTESDSTRQTSGSTGAGSAGLSTPGAIARDARSFARRVGLWASVGGGRGSAGLQCDACNANSEPAFLAHAAIGGTAHERLHVGVELWTYLDVIGNGVDRTARGTQVVARYYVQPTRQWFVAGGVGASRFSIDDGDARFAVSAPALSIGAGWDVPVRGVVLSPSLSLVASSGGALTSSRTGNAVAPDARLGLWRSTIAITWF